VRQGTWRAGAHGRRRDPRAQAVRRSFPPVPSGASDDRTPAGRRETGPGLRREPAGRLPNAGL